MHGHGCKCSTCVESFDNGKRLYTAGCNCNHCWWPTLGKESLDITQPESCLFDKGKVQ